MRKLGQSSGSGKSLKPRFTFASLAIVFLKMINSHYSTVTKLQEIESGVNCIKEYKSLNIFKTYDLKGHLEK